MGDLNQLSTLLTITSTILGFLFVMLGIIINNRMGSLKEKIMDKVDAKFSEMKKEMHDTMVTKDYFNGKFDLLDKKIEWLFDKKHPSGNG